MTVPELLGSFRFTPATGAWTWSRDLYLLHGFAPGDIVPSLELVLAHLHPDDRPEAEPVLRRGLATEVPFASWHRVVAADGAVRQVVMVGRGSLGEVTGYVVDLGDPVREAVNREVREALRAMAGTRPLIEQAKGALMLAYGLAADEAFAVLRRYSQRTNVKVRELAQELTAALAGGGIPADVAEALRRVAGEVAAGATGEVPLPD